MMHGWKLIDFDFDTGAASGDRTITQNLDPFDLSRVEWLDFQLTLTTLDAAGDDLFDLFFEEFDGVGWDQRLRSHQLSGDMSPTEKRRYRISTRTAIDTSDEAYEISSSQGASDIPAGQVRNGPFVPKLPGTTPTAPLSPTHRIRIVIDDNDNDARFAGNLTIMAVSPV